MPSSQSQQFFHLIKKGSSQLEALCSLSDKEKDAIEAHSPEALQAVVEEKRQLLVDFADNVNERNKILVELGLPQDTEGLEQFLDKLPKPQSDTIRKNWQTMEALLKKAVDLNERNEQIVLRSQKNLDKLVRIIRGQEARTTIYSNAGIKNYSAQNTLGKA